MRKELELYELILLLNYTLTEAETTEKVERYRDFLTEKTSDLLDRTQALKQSGYDVSTRDLMAEQKRLRSIPLSQDVITYGPEQMYGAQGTFFGQPLAGGGIAKMAGVSSGPPPESGPNSQSRISKKKIVFLKSQCTEFPFPKSCSVLLCC